MVKAGLEDTDGYHPGAEPQILRYGIITRAWIVTIRELRWYRVTCVLRAGTLFILEKEKDYGLQRHAADAEDRL